MSTAVMMQRALPTSMPSNSMPTKKMVMVLSPAHDPGHGTHIVQPSNGACVIVSNGQHLTNLDAAASGNNNNSKVKNNNIGKKLSTPRTSVVVTTGAAANSAEALRCKRRIQFNQGVSISGHQTASVARRNARERNRVKQVNNGFATLRSHIPPAIAAALQESAPAPSARSAKDKEAAKKLSKVETLRMAVEYIRRLQALLSDSTGNSENDDPAAGINVKAESVLMPDSPNGGFDGDYEAALALSHYSMEAGQAGGHGQPGHGAQHGAHPGAHPGALHFASLSPPCSDSGSAGSPTPSYVSDGSLGASSSGYAPTSYIGSTHCRPHHLGQPPATPPDSTVYEPMSPEDEELLDVISWWQQSN